MKSRLASSIHFQQKALNSASSSHSSHSVHSLRSLQDGVKSLREYLTENQLTLNQSGNSKEFIQVKGDMSAILRILVPLTQHHSVHSITQLSIPKLHHQSRLFHYLLV